VLNVNELHTLPEPPAAAAAAAAAGAGDWLGGAEAAREGERV
jgi:hypothetical protein